MLVSSRYGGFGRTIWQSIEDGTVTIKGAGTCLRAVVCQGRVIRQITRTATDCTTLTYGQGLTVRRGRKLIQQVFYEPGTLRAMRRGCLWKRQRDLTLCGSAGLLECYSTRGGLYDKELFTYANGVRAYTIVRGQQQLEVYRPNGRLWMVLQGQLRPGSYPIAQMLNPKTAGIGVMGVMAGLDLSVKMYGSSGRLSMQGAYVNRQRQGRWLENGRVSYYLSGVRVSRQLGEEDPDQWDGLEVLRIPNTQLRSSFLNKIGYARLLQKVEHQVIDTHADGSQLLEVVIAPGRHVEPGADRIMRLLRVVCPSTGATYVLRVPPNVESCEQARHWTFGLNLENVRNGVRLQLLHET
jgi:hypothetical protein